MSNKHYNFSLCGRILVAFLFSIISSSLAGQTMHDTLPAKATLSDCINYAMVNQPVLKQAKIDEDINRQYIRIALAGWLPQLNADANVNSSLNFKRQFCRNPLVL